MMILKDPATKRVFEMDEATEAGRIRTALKLGWVDMTPPVQQDDEPVEDKPKRTKRGG